MLTASQRIKIISAVAKHLSQSEWPYIDLVLSQFGLPTTDIWSGGDKVAYILDMSKDATDDDLSGLAEHFGVASGEVSSSVKIDPTFWKPNTLKVFVSHLALYRKIAGELQDSLSHFGISAFVAHNDIEPTAEWQTEIENALTTCDALIALLHPNFHGSNWTDQEIGFAMGRGVPIYSIRLGQDPYGFIGKFQAFNGNGKNLNHLSKELFDSYRKNKLLESKMSEILISLLERSGSFESARIRTGYVEEMGVWNSTFSERIASAIKNNNQISDSWGVPERLNAVIEKWDPFPF